jgi:hypothetical protein
MFSVPFEKIVINKERAAGWYRLDLQLPVTIITKVVSLNPAHGKVYLMQLYLIKFVSDLRQVDGFLQFLQSIKLTSI